MVQFIAIVALLALTILAGLGNFWFTYGIWPRSWASFTTFAIICVVLTHMLSAVLKSINQDKS